MQKRSRAAGEQANREGRPQERPGADTRRSNRDDFAVTAHARKPDHDSGEHRHGKRHYQYTGKQCGSDFTGQREWQVGVEREFGEAAGLLGEQDRRQRAPAKATRKAERS